MLWVVLEGHGGDLVGVVQRLLYLPMMGQQDYGGFLDLWVFLGLGLGGEHAFMEGPIAAEETHGSVQVVLVGVELVLPVDHLDVGVDVAFA